MRNREFWRNHYQQFVGWTITEVEVDEDGFVGLVMIKPRVKGAHITWLLSDPEGNGAGFMDAPSPLEED